jgi:hypothetical protein
MHIATNNSGFKLEIFIQHLRKPARFNPVQGCHIDGAQYRQSIDFWSTTFGVHPREPVVRATAQTGLDLPTPGAPGKCNLSVCQLNFVLLSRA